MVYDFWDCPRTGVADFHGNPHAYDATFDEEADDYSDIYELSPISQAQLEAVVEASSIWESCSNSLGPDVLRPSLAIDRDRDEKLRLLIEQALVIDPSKAVRAIATFRLNPSERKRARSWGLQVRWSALDQGASLTP